MDIEQVADFYQQLSPETLGSLEKIYHPKVVFSDPAHQLCGREMLLAYFEQLYRNVKSCRFVITETQQSGDSGFLTWQMHLVHPKLNRGEMITVSGCTHIRILEDKVVYHCDYFDLGEMLYEQLPLLGSLIKRIKAGLGQ